MLTPDQVNIIRTYISTCFLKEWVLEGHYLTGKLIKELEFKVWAYTDRWIMETWGYRYGIIQDKGVPANRIPFDGTKHGGTSLYIQGLINYVSRRMGVAKDSKENLSIVFAIAHTQHKVGMQIRTFGTGTKWLTNSIINIESGLSSIVEPFIFKRFDGIVQNLIDEYNKAA